MSGKPAHIALKEGAKPYEHHVPIPIPFNLKDATAKEIDRDIKDGILEPVPIGEEVD